MDEKTLKCREIDIGQTLSFQEDIHIHSKDKRQQYAVMILKVHF